VQKYVPQVLIKFALALAHGRFWGIIANVVMSVSLSAELIEELCSKNLLKEMRRKTHRYYSSHSSSYPASGSLHNSRVIVHKLSHPIW